MTWGLVAVAGATLVTGGLGYSAAGRAGEQQAGAFEAGIGIQREQLAEQQRQFNLQQEQLTPFREAGVSALEQQQALLGLGTPEEQQAAMEAFAESPGQQFLRAQQERSVLRNAAAIGGLGGGNVRTALQEQAFGRAQTDLSQQFNRLAAISGTGQTAVTQAGQLPGSATAANIANLTGQAGAARASGILGQQQAIGRTTEQLTGLAAQSGIFTPKPPIAAPAAGAGGGT